MGNLTSKGFKIMNTPLYHNIIKPVIPLATNDAGEKVYQTPEETNPLRFEGEGSPVQTTRQIFGNFNQKMAEVEQQRMLVDRI